MHPAGKNIPPFSAPFEREFPESKETNKVCKFIQLVPGGQSISFLFLLICQNTGLGRLRFQVSLGYKAIAIVEIGYERPYNP